MLSALLAAIVADDRDAVRRLLKADPGLATRQIETARLYDERIFHWTYVGDTALHLAAAGYRVEIIDLLLRSGADPNACANHRRGAPLHYASDGYISGPDWTPEPQLRTLRRLLDAGADLGAKDQNGATALHRAVRTRCAEAVDFLLAAGAKPTARNKSGSTPFHLAVQNTGRGGSGDVKAKEAQRRIIQKLLSIGLRPSLTDGKGKTVLESATSAWVRDLLTSTTVPR